MFHQYMMADILLILIFRGISDISITHKKYPFHWMSSKRGTYQPHGLGDFFLGEFFYSPFFVSCSMSYPEQITQKRRSGVWQRSLPA